MLPYLQTHVIKEYSEVPATNPLFNVAESVDEDMSYFAGTLSETVDQPTLLEDASQGFIESSSSSADYYAAAAPALALSPSSSSSSSVCEEEILIETPAQAGCGAGVGSGSVNSEPTTVPKEKVVTPSNKNSDKVLAGSFFSLFVLTCSLQEKVLHHLHGGCVLCYRRKFSRIDRTCNFCLGWIRIISCRFIHDFDSCFITKVFATFKSSANL